MTQTEELPLISVIMPTHNRAELLQRSIVSVLGQTYRELELIVVDDCSSDATPDVVQRFEDPRLRYHRAPTNLGAAGARNAGAAMAKGNWLAFQDDDDMWLVDKLRRQWEALVAHPGSQWCLGSFIQISAQGQIYFGGEELFAELEYSQGIGSGGPNWNLIATPNWLVSRALFEKAGRFDPDIRSWDDWETGLRIRQFEKPIHVQDVGYIQDHIRGSGLMRAERIRGADMHHILRKHGHLWKDQAKVMARHYYVIGRAESLYEPAPAGRNWLWKSLQLAPFKLKTIASLLLAYVLPGRIHDVTTQFRRLRQRRWWARSNHRTP